MFSVREKTNTRKKKITYSINLIFESMKKSYFLTLIAMLFCCLGMHAAAELTFSNVSLAAGSKVEAITQDQQITFNTNMDAEIGYMYAELKDNTADEVVLSRVTVYDPNFNSTGVKDDENPKDAPQNKKDPHFTFVCPSTTTLLEGHNYSLIFYAFTDKDSSHGSSEAVLAKGTLAYEGATAAYVGSRFKLLNVTPDLNTFAITGSQEELQANPSKRSITVNFNAKVRMDPKGTFVNTGFGSSAALEAITPGADKDSVITIAADGKRDTLVYSSSWTLTPKFATMSDGADVLIAANAFDKAGLHVCEGTEYSTGADETSYYNFTVANDYGKMAFNLTPAVDDAAVNSLYSFYIDGISRGVAVAGIKDPAVVYKVEDNGTKTQVAQVVLNAEIGTKHDNGDEVPAALRLFLDTPVTKAGKYILSFPRNYFTYGSNMNAEGSPATTFEYTIKEDFNDPKISIVTPENVEEGVAQLDKLTLKYGAYESVTNNPDGDIPAYVFNESKELVTTGSLEMNYEGDYNEMNVKLAQAITKPGKYTFIVPENAVIEVTEEEFAKKHNGARGIEPDPDEEETFIHCGAFVKEIEVVGGSIDDIVLKTSIENKSTVAKIEALEITFEGASSVETTTSVGMTWWKTPKNVATTNPYYDANYAGGNVTMTNDVAISGNKVTLTPWNGSSKPSKAKYGIDTNATVVLNIPAGYFIVNGISYPEINLIYTIDTATAIDGVSANANSEARSTYTLAGVKVNGENAKNGVFIVNGKKVILK